MQCYDDLKSKSLFKICLFCYNWKFFVESTIKKAKVSWNSTAGHMNNIKKCNGFMNSNKNKLNSKIN